MYGEGVEVLSEPKTTDAEEKELGNGDIAFQTSVKSAEGVVDDDL